jgi:hypothetical protein
MRKEENKSETSEDYISLFQRLGDLIETSSKAVYEVIRMSMLQLYRQLGKHIIIRAEREITGSLQDRTIDSVIQ